MNIGNGPASAFTKTSYQPSPSPVPSTHSSTLQQQQAQALRNLESAFPPFIPGMPGRSVYERAGFDVNRGGKHKKHRKGSAATTNQDAYSDGSCSRMESRTSSSSGSTRSNSSRNFLGLTTNTSSANSIHSNGGGPSQSPTFSPLSLGSGKAYSESPVNTRFKGPAMAMEQPPTPTIPEHPQEHDGQECAPLSIPSYQQQPMQNNKPKSVTLPKIEVIQQDYPTPPQSSTNMHFQEPMYEQQYPEPPQVPPPPPPKETMPLQEPYKFDDSKTKSLEVARMSRASDASSCYSLSKDPIDASPSVSGHQSKAYEFEPRQYSMGQSPDAVKNNNNNNDHDNMDYYSHPSTNTSMSSSSGNRSLYSTSHSNSGNSISTQDSPIDTTPETTMKSNLDDVSMGTNGTIPKGKRCCEGCSQKIVGKAVSAPGCLTGKWHRQCFVCTKCQSPFKSAEFYIFEDAPYCNECYHIENNSVCHGCGTGIEGECLETVETDEGIVPIRYHKYCLACSECDTPLMDEFYQDSDSGTVLCAEHAYSYRRDHRVSGMLEKRRTRLLVV